MAHICDQRHHALGSSFFFRRNGESFRDRPDRLVSTVLRELSEKSPNFASRLSHAIENDPAIATAHISRQFHSLLLDLCPGASSDRPIALVIDAVDEGWSEDLSDVLEACSKLPSWIRLFVTSRDSNSILSRLSPTRHVSSYGIDLNSKSNISDIRVYISERLRTIACNRKLEDWPTDDAVNSMWLKANGSFPWAVAACNSIADVDFDPVEEFRRLVGDDLLQGTQESLRMNDLYSEVLDEYKNTSGPRQPKGTVFLLLSYPDLNKPIRAFMT